MRTRFFIITNDGTDFKINTVKRVKLVKKDLVEKVERFLEQQALGGKIRSQVGDADIVELLSKIGSSVSTEPKIVIARKRYGDEEEDDDDSDLK